jgi:hypothetical protein
LAVGGVSPQDTPSGKPIVRALSDKMTASSDSADSEESEKSSPASSPVPAKRAKTIYLPLIQVGSIVTISTFSVPDCSIEKLVTGQLLGHFRAVEYAEPMPSVFHKEDMVYIQSAPGVRHVGSLVSATSTFFQHENSFRESIQLGNTSMANSLCPVHGPDCVMGQHLSQY